MEKLKENKYLLFNHTQINFEQRFDQPWTLEVRNPTGAMRQLNQIISCSK